MEPVVVLDATPLDTGHRTRGIGRYVQGLIEGFETLKANGGLSVNLKLLRAPQKGRDAHTRDAPNSFESVTYPRRMTGGAATMFLENQLRLDTYLPPDTALYHASSMEGVSKRFPWVATCHDLIPLLLRGPYLKPWNLSARWFWPTYAKLLRDSPRQIVATSHHVKGTLCERFGIDAERIHVIHHGLSPFWFEPPTTEGVNARVQAIAQQRDFVLFVGGFDPRKNLPLLLRALSVVPPSLRPRLLLAGVCSRMTRLMHIAQMKRYGIDGHFLGYVNDYDLRWLYATTRGLVFPSVEEGWGFPIVEAMAVGAAVVCAPWGSMVEASGGAALTVDVRDHHALAGAICELKQERSENEAGKRHAQTLTWESHARALASVYRSACAI